ncbi:MAG: SRPBCC family protein [Candidatus Rokuibacteriota bacterium]
MLGRCAMLALVGALIAPVVGHPVGAAEPDHALTGTERERLDRGDLVVRARAVEGFPWPEVTVYAWVGATPDEVMAVYADFDAHVTFLPEMVQSRIVGHDGPTDWRVFYEYEVAGPNERYTVTARLRRVTGGYETAWDLVTARYARRLSGEMRVLESDRGSLVRYVSRVDPGTLGATLGSPESVERRLRATVRALTRHVEQLRAERTDQLAGLVQKLRLAVRADRPLPH